MDILKLRGISLFVVAFCLLILALVIWQRAEKDKVKIWLGFSAFFTALYAFFAEELIFFGRQIQWRRFIGTGQLGWAFFYCRLL